MMKVKISNLLHLIAVKILLPARVTANQITIAGFVLTCIGASFILQGSLFTAGCILLVGASLDMLDGIMARTTGSASSQGSLLDSFFDRISEAVIFTSIVSYYILPNELSSILVKVEILAVFIALASSLMVSYLRAKGESLGVNSSVGWITRPERMVLIVTGLITTPWFSHTLFLSILVIATGSVIVSAQRFRVIWRAIQTP